MELGEDERGCQRRGCMPCTARQALVFGDSWLHRRLEVVQRKDLGVEQIEGGVSAIPPICDGCGTPCKVVPDKNWRSIENDTVRGEATMQ